MIINKRHALYTGILVTLAVLGGLTGCGGDSSNDSDTAPATGSAGGNTSVDKSTNSGWQLVWSDEFDGDSLNAANWNIQTGDGTEYGIPGWGNNEQEWYQGDNISVSDGNLVITAREEASNGYPYTSGRLRTNNKVDITYGRIEARIQVPAGQGLWSAFWMLPTDSQYGGWASGGEIDIMEAVNPGLSENVVHGTIHYGMAWPLNVSAGHHYEVDLTDGFHEYAVEWEQGEIRWYVDGVHYHTVTADHWWSYFYGGLESGYTSPANAPFDQDFHILLNLAVGGNWPGNPDENTVFPAQMLVDYVRVYECSVDNVTGIGCASSVDADVEIPAADDVYTASYDLYTDGAESLAWTVGEETVTRELGVASFWTNDGALILSETAMGDEHGTVIDINTTNSGNISIYATDGEPFTLLGMGNSANWWELHAGELKFDLFIDSAGTDPDSTLLVKLDSGWPALGFVELSVADLPQDTWTSVSVPINTLLVNSGDQPLDTSSVVNLFVLEPTSYAHVQVDNIQLVCGHKDDNGCGIAPPAVEVTGDTLEVFTDAVAATWGNGIGAWDNVANTDYFDGATSNHVNWSLVESGESGHDTVIEVDFKADGGNGVFYIQSPTGVDLSDFASGKLVFDLKVLDYGSNTSGMVMKVDCGYPCTSGDQSLGVVASGAWQTIEVEVNTLAAGGLDLDQVNTGIVIFPTWDDQQGVTFLLDNVRWEVGGGEL